MIHLFHRVVRRSKLTCSLVCLIVLSSLVVNTSNVVADEPFFTLQVIYRTYSSPDDPIGSLLLIMEDQIDNLNINLEPIGLNWLSFVECLLNPIYHDMILLPPLLGDFYDPDSIASSLFSEEALLNFWSYDQTLDWNQTLGMGQNEWFLEEGRTIFPYNSQERITQYWNWQMYLMDKLLPGLPGLSKPQYLAHRASLKNYSYSDRLLQSWGKMHWEELPENKTDATEIAIAGKDWTMSTPFLRTSFDSGSSFFTSAVADPLFWVDPDKSIQPHLATDMEFLNNTHLRINLREGIKWQLDQYGLFPGEYFDVRDVYFTIFAWKYLASVIHSPYEFNWLEDMRIVDDYTIDLYLQDNETFWEDESAYDFLYDLNVEIMPEHFFNQTQLVDGTTPDRDHPSWIAYGDWNFGTGHLQLFSDDENETRLEVFPDAWWLNSTITSDSNLDWGERFGYNWELSKLIVRKKLSVTHDATVIEALLWGFIDMLEPLAYDDVIMLEQTFEFAIQTKSVGFFPFIGFNTNQERNYFGNRDPCPLDPTISIGLAIRKAVAYALDRHELNNLVYNGRYFVNEHPLPTELGFWLNPDIIVYDQDYAKAKEFMEKAGFEYNTEPLGVSFLSIVLFIPIYFLTRKKKSSILRK